MSQQRWSLLRPRPLATLRLVSPSIQMDLCRSLCRWALRGLGQRRPCRGVGTTFSKLSRYCAVVVLEGPSGWFHPAFSRGAHLPRQKEVVEVCCGCGSMREIRVGAMRADRHH